MEWEVFERPEVNPRAVARWVRTYGHYQHHELNDTRKMSKYRITQKLKQLGDSPKSDDIDKIIGNESWTHNMCDICDVYSAKGLFIDAGEYGHLICMDCLPQFRDVIDQVLS